MLIWVSTADWQTRHFLLLDRDGVVNADHPDYIKHRGEFRFYQDSLRLWHGCIAIISVRF